MRLKFCVVQAARDRRLREPSHRVNGAFIESSVVSRTQRLLVVLTLNLALVAGLVIVGVSAHSLAVLAEGGDYLLDAAAVGMALFAIRLAARPASRSRPDGHPGPTDIAALVNAGWLLILELLVAGAALYRLINHTPPVDGLPVLIVSGIAAVVMAAGALILHRDQGGQDDKQERDLSLLLSCSTPLPTPPGWRLHLPRLWRQALHGAASARIMGQCLGPMRHHLVCGCPWSLEMPSTAGGGERGRCTSGSRRHLPPRPSGRIFCRA